MNIKIRREFLSVVARFLSMSLVMVPVHNLLKKAHSGELHPSTSFDKRPPSNPKSKYVPGYVNLHKSGKLKQIGKLLWDRMTTCDLCPRECGAARLEGERGFCGASADLEIYSHHAHYGEEQSLVGRSGSGTIFFSNCNLRCVFCINWEISQGGHGSKRQISELSQMMLDLQNRGCHNINVVTPTHYSPHIVLALDKAAKKGLQIPLVYNTCGWEKSDILNLLAGVVDIYLPDFKYADSEMADLYSSGAESYPEITKSALLEMNRQVGAAHPADNGLMYKGLMIRHLVMPNNVSGSETVMQWIADHLPKDTYVNIMSQYRPTYKAYEYPEISRKINSNEYDRVIKKARQAGLINLDIQG